MTAVPPGALVIGLGGNVGGDTAILDRFARVRAALAAWGAVRGSAVYRTAPIGGPPGQGDFLNAAVAVTVDLPAPGPAEVLALIAGLETALGRDRRGEVKDGPRPIDLDVLLWGERVARWPGLDVPHPRLAGRRFALAPVIDLLGDGVVIPGTGATAGALYAALDHQAVVATGLRI